MNDTFEIETIDQSAVLRETISNIKNVFLSLSDGDVCGFPYLFILVEMIGNGVES